MAWIHYKLYRPYALCLVFLILINLFLWFYPVIDAGTVFRLCPGYWALVFLLTIPLFLAFPVIVYTIYAVKYFKIPAVEQAALPGEVQASKTTFEYLKTVGFVLLAILTLLATCMCLIMTAVAAAYHNQHMSLVQDKVSIVEGAVVKGDKIVIERDNEGFTHIQGSDIEDVAFGLGFTHARDRLFQMDYYRRIARGQLAEVAGDRALNCDKYMRTLGLYQSGQDDYTTLSDDTKTFLTRYTAGVNYYKGRYGQSNKAFETTVLSYDIADWSVYDSMAVLKLWQLLNSGNANLEMLRFYLATVKGLSVDRVMDLVPMTPLNSSYASFSPQDLDTPTELSKGYIQQELASLQQSLQNSASIQNSVGVKTPKSTSTSYTVPSYSNIDELFAYFDPVTTFFKHNSDWFGAGGFMFGTALYPDATSAYVSSRGEGFRTQLPNPAYVTHLKLKSASTTLSTMGPTIPGIPGLLEGRSGLGAWTISTMYADCMDWYIVYNVTSNPLYYYANGGTYNYTYREEKINVKGADPVTITVRNTIYGPIMTDLLPDSLKYGNIQMALQWTGNVDTDNTMDWVTGAWQTLTLDDFNTLTANKFNNPPMNMLTYFRSAYAVYFGVGRLPQRQNGHSGLFPALADGSAAWLGWNSPIVNARAFFAKKKYFVNANNKPVSIGYRYNFGYDFPTSYRARRLNDRISSFYTSTQIIPVLEDDIRLIIRDRVNVYFSEDLKPLLDKAADKLSDTDMAASLKSWQGGFEPNSFEPVIAQKWYYELSRVAAVDTGVAYWDNPVFIQNVFLPNYVYNKNGTIVTADTVSSATQQRNIQACVLALSTIYKVTATSNDQTACDDFAAQALAKVVKQYGRTRLSSIYPKQWSHYITEPTNINCVCARDSYALGGGEFTVLQSAPIRPTMQLDASQPSGMNENSSPSFYSNQGFYFEQYAYLGPNSAAATNQYIPKMNVAGGITGHQWDKGIYDTFQGMVIERGDYLQALLSSYSVASSQTLEQVKV
nr:unnamed protein product [Naegleria fowleri]